MRTASIFKAMNMEAVHTSEMLVHFNVTAQRYIRELSELQDEIS
jgi:hypothetical protein